MNRRIGRCFLIAFLLFIRPSSGFFKDKCNIDIELPKLPEGKINARDVIVAAGALLTMFQDNPSLKEKAPSTYKLVVDLVRTKVVTATHLAYVGAGIYGAAVLLTTYCYDIHSRRLLAEAHAINNNLDIMFEAEITPILQRIEGLFNGDTKDVCDAEIKLKKMLKDRILRIQTTRNDIKEKRQETIESQQQVAYLVLGAFATMAVSSSIVFGVPATAAVFGGYFITVLVLVDCKVPTRYQQVLELLNQADYIAIEDEKMLTLSHTKIETNCLGFA